MPCGRVQWAHLSDSANRGRVGVAHAHDGPQRAQVHQALRGGAVVPQPLRHGLPGVGRDGLEGHLRRGMQAAVVVLDRLPSKLDASAVAACMHRA